MAAAAAKKSNSLRGNRDRRRGPSHARKPMPLKRCEWCRNVIERRPGEKSVFFKVRRFCDRKCMSKAREMEKKIKTRLKKNGNILP